MSGQRSEALMATHAPNSRPRGLSATLDFRGRPGISCQTWVSSALPDPREGELLQFSRRRQVQKANQAPPRRALERVR